MKTPLQESSIPQCTRLGRWGLTSLCLVSIWGCHFAQPKPTVSADELRRANTVVPVEVSQAIIPDPTNLGEMFFELSPRLGVLIITNADEWNILASQCPEIGPSPDFSKGIAVGVVSRVGHSVSGQWPIQLKYGKIVDGAGLIIAKFKAGSYFPDSASYAEIGFFEGLNSVALIEINNVTHIPKQP